MDSALNLGYDEWPNFLGNRPMVEALLSRLRHYCHTVRIDGPSLCQLQGWETMDDDGSQEEYSSGAGGVSPNAPARWERSAVRTGWWRHNSINAAYR
jgi:hypothetical protein